MKSSTRKVEKSDIKTTKTSRGLVITFSEKPQLKKIGQRKTIDLFIEDMYSMVPRHYKARLSNAQILEALTERVIRRSKLPYLLISEAVENVNNALVKEGFSFKIDYWYYLGMLTTSPKFIVTCGRIFLV